MGGIMNFKTMKIVAYLIMALPIIIAFGASVVVGLLHKSDWWFNTNIAVEVYFSALIFSLLVVAMFSNALNEILRRMDVMELWISGTALIILAAITAKMMDMPPEMANSWLTIATMLVIMSLISGGTIVVATFVFWDSLTKATSVSYTKSETFQAATI